MLAFQPARAHPPEPTCAAPVLLVPKAVGAQRCHLQCPNFGDISAEKTEIAIKPRSGDTVTLRLSQSSYIRSKFTQVSVVFNNAQYVQEKIMTVNHREPEPTGSSVPQIHKAQAVCKTEFKQVSPSTFH